MTRNRHSSPTAVRTSSTTPPEKSADRTGGAAAAPNRRRLSAGPHLRVRSGGRCLGVDPWCAPSCAGRRPCAAAPWRPRRSGPSPPLLPRGPARRPGGWRPARHPAASACLILAHGNSALPAAKSGNWSGWHPSLRAPRQRPQCREHAGQSPRSPDHASAAAEARGDRVGHVVDRDRHRRRFDAGAQGGTGVRPRCRQVRSPVSRTR